MSRLLQPAELPDQFRTSPRAADPRRRHVDGAILLRHTIVIAEVTWEAEAAAQFDELPRTIKARVVKLVERLEAWPEVSGARPLSGELAGHWRMRTGDYRLQFRVAGEEVILEQVGHRDGFYDT